MGIQGLTKLLAEKAPKALISNSIESYFGRKVAIDASMSIYQFLIAVRQPNGDLLVNSNGDVTSHIMGLFYRTVRMVDNGIKPCYVFDGKPPTLKSGELAKRKERREKAEEDLQKAQEAGEAEQVISFTKRLVKVTKEHNDDCKKLLTLMGIPYVEAPCEAEAQCAALCKSGKVYASGSEDMDTLTFDSPKLLRHLTYAESKKVPIAEFDVSKVLEGLQLTMDQFIDLCILLGCDYCDSIKGIGPVKAFQLINQHKNLETIIQNLDKKYTVPENFDYVQARELFKSPEVLDPEKIELKWNNPDKEGLLDFLVNNMGFDDKRVLAGIEKLNKNLAKGQQSRIEDFFKKTGTTTSTTPVKRRVEPQGKGKNDKGKKKSSGRPPIR